MNKQKVRRAIKRKKHAKALNKLNIATMRFDNEGKLISSRFTGGSFDAFKHEPRSLKNPNSFMRQIIDATAEFRTNGKVWASGEIVTKVYNDKHKPVKPKRIDTITKILSRLYTWRIVDYRENTDRRGGLWGLRCDIDPSDGEDMFLRAMTQIELYKKFEISVRLP